MSRKTKRKHITREAEDLQRTSLAVQEEVFLLFSTHEMLHQLGATWQSNPHQQALSNAILNAFLLSARTLLGFLYAHDPRQNDIIAEDFFDTPDGWLNTRFIPEQELADGTLRDNISKRLAHLTWERKDASLPLWGGFAIAWNIGLTLQSFVDTVDKSKIHQGLVDGLRIAMERLETARKFWEAESNGMAPITEFANFDKLSYFNAFVTDLGEEE